jgi:hypothetical protein
MPAGGPPGFVPALSDFEAVPSDDERKTEHPVRSIVTRRKRETFFIWRPSRMSDRVVEIGSCFGGHAKTFFQNMQGGWDEMDSS